MSRRDGGQGKTRLISLVAIPACIVEGVGGGKAAKDRGVGGSMRVDTNVLASEVISGVVNAGGVNRFSGGK